MTTSAARALTRSRVGLRVAAACVVVAIVFSSRVSGFEELTATLHGSGTTNPSRYLWRASAMLQARSKVPLHATYRAVGSSAGRAEFVANSNDYGASELPMSAAQLTAVADGGDVTLHFPLNIGAIGVFVHLPDGSELARPGASVNATASVLARIFSRSITTWDDPALAALNPGLSVPPASPITVLHRVFGSSSTSLLSEYLHAGAPSDWTVRTGSGDPFGATLVWPVDTVGVEGSSQMTAGLGSTPGSFGYLDAGHGQDAGLAEVALLNAAGVFLTSAQADIAAAAAVAPLPPGGSSDSWESVTLVNQGGASTWPIVSFTYLLLRQNQTRADAASDAVYGPHRTQPDSGALLKAFATFLFSDEGQSLAESFGFTALPPSVLSINAAGLDSLILADGVPEFAFETSTNTVVGPAERTLSVKRNSYTLVTLDDHTDKIDDAAVHIAALEANVASLTASVNALTATVSALNASLAQATAAAAGAAGSANYATVSAVAAADDKAGKADDKASDALGVSVFGLLILIALAVVVVLLWRRAKTLASRVNLLDADSGTLIGSRPGTTATASSAATTGGATSGAAASNKRPQPQRDALADDDYRSDGSFYSEGSDGVGGAPLKSQV